MLDSNLFCSCILENWILKIYSSISDAVIRRIFFLDYSNFLSFLWYDATTFINKIKLIQKNMISCLCWSYLKISQFVKLLDDFYWYFRTDFGWKQFSSITEIYLLHGGSVSQRILDLILIWISLNWMSGNWQMMTSTVARRTTPSSRYPDHLLRNT